MSKFSLSKRSIKRLSGVDPKLVSVVKKAIKITKVDFGVVEGVRSLDRQKELYEKGASQTVNSKHLTGQAVDLVAFIDNRISWELSFYDEIANAMRIIAARTNTKIRWGGAWHVEDIRKTKGKNMEQLIFNYVALRKKQKRKAFIDAPHFELS